MLGTGRGGMKAADVQAAQELGFPSQQPLMQLTANTAPTTAPVPLDITAQRAGSAGALSTHGL